MIKRLLFFFVVFSSFLFVGYEFSRYLVGWIDENGYPVGGTRGKLWGNENEIPVSGTQSEHSSLEFFPSSGYWIGGKIKSFYNSTHNPKKIFGLPVSDEFIDAISGHRFQYFEKARLEIHVRENGEEYVKVAPLGSLFYEPGEPLNNPSIGGCKSIGDIGFLVCFDFLDFFEQYGGVELFGNPISEFEIHNGWIVQYFENFRFEWRPDLAETNSVVVSNLGLQHFHSNNFSYSSSKSYGQNIPDRIEYIKVGVQPEVQIVENGDLINIYIFVVDQISNPVDEALLVYSIYYPDDTSEQIFPGLTDETGTNVSVIEINSSICGVANIEVAAGHGEIMNEASSSIEIFCTNH